MVVNSRWGKKFMSESAYRDRVYFVGTDRLMSSTFSNWEHINTIGDSWGYSETHQSYKSPEQINELFNAVRDVGCKRFTINIGPKPNGQLDPEEESVLSRIVLR